jgi:CBS domain-containing protein
MIIQTIRQITAGRAAPRLPPTITVRAACMEFTRLDVGAAVVMEGDRLLGVISERDVIRKCICGGRKTDETAVAEIMTPDPVTIDAGASLAEAFARMTAGKFRHLPVLDGGQVTALLSIRDIPTEYRLMAERFAEYREGQVA